MFAVPQNIKIITVTKLNRFAKQVLESEIGQVWVSGEISNFTRASSGHWYFTLKDDNAQVRTAMFKGSNQKVAFTPKHGDKVIVRANLSLYEARGDYQLIAIAMEPEGIGKLKQEFEALKVKLQIEGLFDQSNKQRLPDTIRRIGLVTSPTGAAVHDILHVLKRRNPAIEVIIYPSMVQGSEAAQSITKQILIANQRDEVDVLIIGRGGGSLEDLWPFNEELVARAIYASKLPTVSAVGHEVDVTIADFVADMRAATPSAAAELLSEDSQTLLKRLNERKISLMRAFASKLYYQNEKRGQLIARLQSQHPVKKLQQNIQAFDYLYARLQQQHPQKLINTLNQQHCYLFNRLQARDPKTQIKSYKEISGNSIDRLTVSLTKKLEQSTQKSAYLFKQLEQLSPKSKVEQLKVQYTQINKALFDGMNQVIHNSKQNLAKSSALLNSVSPLAVLSRGYSFTIKDAEIVDDINKITINDTIETRVKNGVIICKVSNTKKN